jgi:asparagine synthase (glutamine-hydrolysing)
MRLGFMIEISTDGLKAEMFREDAQEPGPLLSVAETADLFAIVLGTIGGEDDAGPSAERALRAYRHAGVTALMRLRGDFALTLWDARERRLLALRDPGGGYPLFWAEQQSGFVLATALRPLAAATGKGALDRVYLGAFLCASEITLSELDIARTAYEGIARVPPGVCLAFVPRTKRLDRLAIWSWEEEVARTEVGTWPEAVKSFHDRLDCSVRSRLRGRVAAHLSGGMDSTSLCALASRALRAHPAGEALHAVSLVFERSPALAQRPV